MNLIFNITFHQHLDQLKFHLSNILNWKNSSLYTYILCSAHKVNLELAGDFIKNNFPNIKYKLVFVDNDLGYHKGTFENVRQGIKHIINNFNYDFIINVEADNMFWSEEKFDNIVSLMVSKKKHFLIIPEGFQPEHRFRNSWKDKVSDYIHFTTLNIFSKYFVENIFPLDIVDKFYNFGWCGQEGTPFEAYVALCINDKLQLNTRDDQEKFYLDNGLYLEYDYFRVVYPGWYYPDNLVPDKFIKWGIVNCHSTAGGRLSANWQDIITFIKLHEGIK